VCVWGGGLLLQAVENNSTQS